MYSKKKEYNIPNIEMLTNLQFVQEIADQLIRPRPSNYTASDMWQHISNKQLYKYENSCFNLSGQRFVNLHLIEKKTVQNIDKHQPSTCIVYLHGFCSFCTEGNFLIKNLQKQFKNMNVSVCLYDMRGHGKDKGKNITFGLQESNQLCQILIHLKNQKHYKNFVLWGRSMGATTILKMLNDHKNRISQENICIKHLILDSGFSSFEKVARQMISKKSGMPMLFSKPIFQCLLSAIEKQHKIKLIVQLDKISSITPPALFLYSENDDMISAEHTKSIYEQYSGIKQKIQLSVGHNQQRPHFIMKEVFSVLRKALRDPLQLRKRSVSCKKMGLSVTKNSQRVKTIQTLFDDQQDLPISLQNKFKQLIKTPKNKAKKAQQKFNCHKQTPHMEVKHDLLELSPRPLKISKVSQYFDKKTKKSTINHESNQMQHEKQNLNTLNVQKKQNPKKDKKLKLSHRDLDKDLSTENIHLLKNSTHIQENVSSLHYDNFQTKKVSNQPSFQKLYTPYEFGQNNLNEPTSIFMTRTPIKNKESKKEASVVEKQQFSFKDLNDIKQILNKNNQKTMIKRLSQQQRSKQLSYKNNLQQQLLNKKLSVVQNEKKINQKSFKKQVQYQILKPPSGNIHRLQSKTHNFAVQNTCYKNNQKLSLNYQEKKFVESNIRNTINSQLLKDETQKRNSPVLYDNLSSFNPKSISIKDNFQTNQRLYVSNVHHIRYLSNQNYL